MPHHIIADFPAAPWEVGGLVSEPHLAAKLQRQGAVLLPIDPELRRSLAHGGFSRRDFGMPGWVYNRNSGEKGAPLALQIQPEVPFVHWAARVVPMSSLALESASGRLRLHCDNSSAATLQAGLAQEVHPEPFQNMTMDGLVLRGRGRLNTLMGGFLGLSLWGVCQGVAVHWVAATQASES